MREVHAKEQALAELAHRQHGVVGVGQLRDLGFSKDAIYARASAGRLHRIHRGVYAVGHSRLGNEGRWIAAILACGEGAVLSHRSAAELLGLLDPRGGPVDVTVRRTGGRARRPGLRIHRSSLPRSAVTRRCGIEVTTPARTLSDLRRTVAAKVWRRAVRQAEVRGYDLGQLEADHTRSELERMFLRLCRRYGLPLPEVNARVAGHTVDFFWRREGLVVEVDGWRYHRGRAAFEDDRQRDLELARHGIRALRLTHRQITGKPREVASAVMRALVARSSS